MGSSLSADIAVDYDKPPNFSYTSIAASSTSSSLSYDCFDDLKACTQTIVVEQEIVTENNDSGNGDYDVQVDDNQTIIQKIDYAAFYVRLVQRSREYFVPLTRFLNELLLDREYQDIIHQTLLHNYALTTQSSKQIWIKLMGEGLSAIDKILSSDDLELSITDYNKVMTQAAFNGHQIIVKTMLQRGANAGASAIIQAARGGHLPIIQLLLSGKWKSSFPKPNLNTAIGQAAFGGHISVIDFLLKNDASINWAMAKAAQAGRKLLVQRLVQRGATDFNQTMVYAAFGGYPIIIEFMLQLGANQLGRAINSAARAGHQDIIKLLLSKATTKAQQAGIDLGQALCEATYHNHIHLVQYLLDEGVTDIRCAIGEACKNGDLPILELLLEKSSARCNCIKMINYGLFWAISNDHRPIVEFLLKRLANASKAIHIAVKCNNISMVEFILNKLTSRRVELVNVVLDSAAFTDNIVIAEWALLRGATCLDEALSNATARGNISMMKWLLAKGAGDLDRALVRAACSRHKPAIELLLTHGADIDQALKMYNAPSVHVLLRSYKSSMP